MHRLGIDLDGVLAEFNKGVRTYACEVLGRTLPDYTEPTQWNYLQPQYGLTPKEEGAIWQAIQNDERFWRGLGCYDNTKAVLDRLAHATLNGTDVYFLTTRPGIRSKGQSEAWLEEHGFPKATVLITPDKGPVAKGLRLTAFIDDKPENCFDVRMHSPRTRVYMLRRGWNRKAEADIVASEGVINVHAVDSFEEFLELEGVG